MEFVKKGELTLKNGGYLSNKKGEPITNAEFIAAQEKAHYLVRLSQAVEGKDFQGKKPDNFESIVNDVVNSIAAESTVRYSTEPTQPSMSLRDQLAEEALNWVKFEENKTLSERVNEAMQPFNVIRDYEEFGLFFSSGIVKLSNIYTIEQILNAVQIVEPLLNKTK